MGVLRKKKYYHTFALDRIWKIRLCMICRKMQAMYVYVNTTLHLTYRTHTTESSCPNFGRSFEYYLCSRFKVARIAILIWWYIGKKQTSDPSILWIGKKWWLILVMDRMLKETVTLIRGFKNVEQTIYCFHNADWPWWWHTKIGRQTLLHVTLMYTYWLVDGQIDWLNHIMHM